MFGDKLLGESVIDGQCCPVVTALHRKVRHTVSNVVNEEILLLRGGASPCCTSPELFMRISFIYHSKVRQH